MRGEARARGGSAPSGRPSSRTRRRAPLALLRARARVNEMTGTEVTMTRHIGRARTVFISASVDETTARMGARCVLKAVLLLSAPLRTAAVGTVRPTTAAYITSDELTAAHFAFLPEMPIALSLEANPRLKKLKKASPGPCPVSEDDWAGVQQFNEPRVGRPGIEPNQ